MEPPLTPRSSPGIRKAKAPDLDALLQLEQSSFTSDLLSRRRMLHWIKAENGILLVAMSNDNTLLGYCLGILRRNSSTARLYSLATAAAARGRGIGSMLIKRAEQEARKQGCSVLRLEVAESNTGALALYTKLGYVQFDFVPGFYEDGQNAVRMQKNLK